MKDFLDGSRSERSGPNARPAVSEDEPPRPPAKEITHGLPDGYELQPDGIWRHKLDDSGDVITQWFCSPIKVVGSCASKQGKDTPRECIAGSF